MEKPDLSFQPGFEKVVLYQRPDRPIPGHAAIQLPNGKWRSKLSWDELIEHDTAEQLVGTSYGGIHQVWIRPINWDKWLELIKKR
jgi:hypothetical protein